MAPKDLKVLRLLMDHPGGLYGSELVDFSDGYLVRGTIYTLLDRLVDKGYIKEIEDSPTQSSKLARTRHYITGSGVTAINEYAKEMGFELSILRLGGADV